jgi:hypothetical protein
MRDAAGARPDVEYFGTGYLIDFKYIASRILKETIRDRSLTVAAL